VAVEMPKHCALLMMTMYGHGEMVIMANWVVEVPMAARLVFFFFGKVRISVEKMLILLCFLGVINRAFLKSPIIIFRHLIGYDAQPWAIIFIS
jgi:hypothetical protein